MKCGITLPAVLLIAVSPAIAYPQCVTVAIVFERSICQSEIAIPIEHRVPEAAPQRDHRLRLEKARLGSKIREIAAEHLLAKSAYTPTRKEVDAFESFSARAEARQATDDAQVVATAETLLNTHEYDERSRQSLENTIATFGRSLARSKERAEEDRMRDEDVRRRFGDEYVEKLYQRLKESRRRISEDWVARWKMNKALFEKYGGRVIFQQAGIEPIDAYRAFLKDIREKGALKILEPEHADVFDEFERYLDMGHNYLSESGETFFDRPYWETIDLDAEQRKRIEELEAVPHK